MYPPPQVIRFLSHGVPITSLDCDHDMLVSFLFGCFNLIAILHHWPILQSFGVLTAHVNLPFDTEYLLFCR